MKRIKIRRAFLTFISILFVAQFLYSGLSDSSLSSLRRVRVSSTAIESVVSSLSAAETAQAEHIASTLGIEVSDVVSSAITEAQALSTIFGTTLSAVDIIRGIDFSNQDLISGILTRIQAADEAAKERGKVVAMGGGGGFINVVLQALRSNRQNGFIRAAMPGTDNGGSTGKLQDRVVPGLGYVFGMGDMVNLLVDTSPKDIRLVIDTVLSNRPKTTDSATDIFNAHLNEVRGALVGGDALLSLDNSVFFISSLLTIAETIDETFLNDSQYDKFLNIKGDSLRNLAALAIYQLTGAYEGNSAVNQDLARVANHILGRIFHSEMDPATGFSVVEPVVSYYGAAVSYVVYNTVLTAGQIDYIKDKGLIKESQADALKRGQNVEDSPVQIIDDGNHTVVFGQKFIDQVYHSGEVVAFGLVEAIPSAVATLDDIKALNVTDPATQLLIDDINDPNTTLFTLGSGSLYSSLLCQLTAPGVAEALANRDDGIPKVLFVNHVLTDETRQHTLTRFLEIIKEATGQNIEDMFTHIVVNDSQLVRAIGQDWQQQHGVSNPEAFIQFMAENHAEEIAPDTWKIDSAFNPLQAQGQDLFIQKTITGYYFSDAEGEPIFVSPDGTLSSSAGDAGAIRDEDGNVIGGIYLNPYTYHVIQGGMVADAEEMSVAGFLYMGEHTYESRRERGRYRGAFYATNEEIAVLTTRGIAVISEPIAGWTTKTIKGEAELGHVSYETFVGITSEAIAGIMRQYGWQ